MPTPDIDNTIEEIQVPDQFPESDVVSTPTLEQSGEVLTSGTENPQPQIEAKTTNLIEVLNRLQNIAVESFFAVNPEDTEAIAEQRSYFKDALTIDTEADNLITAFAKVYAFDRFQGLDSEKLNEVYLLPPSEVANIDLRDKPKLKLYFVETNYLSDSGRDIADGQIAGIRLMDFTAESISRADGVALGERIRDTFKDFIWQKGKSNLTYSDPSKGYNIQILCESKEGGLEALAKVLSLQNHDIESKRVSFKISDSPEEAYPDVSEEVQRLDRPAKTRVSRPVCTVRIRAAFLYVNALMKPVVLYDRSGYYPNPYVTDEA